MYMVPVKQQQPRICLRDDHVLHYWFLPVGCHRLLPGEVVHVLCGQGPKKHAECWHGQVLSALVVGRVVCSPEREGLS
jgi:hypothetical protein